MEILCAPVKTTEEEMRDMLSHEGKLSFNRLVVRGKEITRMELRYVEYFVMKYDMIHKKGYPWSKLPEDQRTSKQKVYLLGNGSTGAVSHMEMIPEMETTDIPKDQIQRADFDVDSMQRTAKATMIKLHRRHMGGRMPSFQLLETISFYRPFWLIYYNSTRKDGRTLCSVRAADGYWVGKV